MAITDFAAKLDAANTLYSDRFAAVSDLFPGFYQQLAENLGPSTATKLEVGYVDDLGPIRTLQPGESRMYDGGRAYSTTYEMETLYLSMEMTRRQFEYDHSGRIGRMMSQFVARAALMWENKVWESIQANSLLGPDGVALISAAHPNGPAGATQSNSTTSVLSHATYRAGRAAMQSFQKENGEYLGMAGTHLYVHPDEEPIAKEITGADRPFSIDNTGAEATASVVASTTIGNVFQGDVVVVVTSRMASGDWLIVDQSKPGVRPWVVSIGEDPKVHAPSEDDEALRQRDMLQWFIQGDLIQGPGHWQSIYGRIQ